MLGIPVGTVKSRLHAALREDAPDTVRQAVQAALDVAHNGAGAACGLGATYLTGTIDWPGNNITLQGAGSAYSYNTSASPKFTTWAFSSCA